MRPRRGGRYHEHAPNPPASRGRPGQAVWSASIRSVTLRWSAPTSGRQHPICDRKVSAPPSQNAPPSGGPARDRAAAHPAVGDGPRKAGVACMGLTSQRGRCPRVGERRSSPISRSLSPGRPGGPGPPGGGVVAGSFSSSGTALNTNPRGKARQAEQLGPAIEQSPGRLTDMIEKRQWSSPMALGASRYSIQPSCFWKPRPS